MRNSRQALRVPDEQITARLEVLTEIGDDFLLSLAVEINHYITAEDHRKLVRPTVRFHEVDATERCHIADSGSHAIFSRGAGLSIEIARHPSRRHPLAARRWVHRPLRN